MPKHPVIDIGRCTDCESCLEICPAVFKRNPETGLIEIVDLDAYPEEEIQEAINMCPVDCILWNEDDPRGLNGKGAAMVSIDACKKRAQCPDCDQCQSCSQSRCRMCKKGGHKSCASQLGPGMTYGEYLEWKKRKGMRTPGPPSRKTGQGGACCGEEKT